MNGRGNRHRSRRVRESTRSSKGKKRSVRWFVFSRSMADCKVADDELEVLVIWAMRRGMTRYRGLMGVIKSKEPSANTRPNQPRSSCRVGRPSA
jgi:hypothetical protein